MRAFRHSAAAVAADFLSWASSGLSHFELERRRFSLATAIGWNFLPEASRCFFNPEIGKQYKPGIRAVPLITPDSYLAHY
jgi:hypothetical protein